MAIFEWRFNMDNILQFIDSPDIREHNKDTKFTPAQQAVLIYRSQKRSVEDKINVLKELIHEYTADEFGFMDRGKEKISYRKAAENTLLQWEKAMEERSHNEGVVFLVNFDEKNCMQIFNSDRKVFSTYEKAYHDICTQKKQYLNDEDLKNIETAAEILRVKIDTVDSIYASDFGYYRFDTDMVMIEAEPTDSMLESDESVLADLSFYIPLPFRAGDIVKYESPFCATYYGVFSHDWEMPRNRYGLSMNISLDLYYEKDHAFDFTDDTAVLNLSRCKDEDLPEDQKMLKVIRAIRKGELDFYSILYHLSFGRLEQLVKWFD